MRVSLHARSYERRSSLVYPRPFSRPLPSTPRVSVVHDWLLGMRGGERCLEGILELFADPRVHTLFHEPGSVSSSIEAHPIQSSPLSRFAITRRRHRLFLPLFPWAVNQLGTEEADAIVSLSNIGMALQDYVSEIDINPVIVSETGAIAVDALVIKKQTRAG